MGTSTNGSVHNMYVYINQSQTRQEKVYIVQFSGLGICCFSVFFVGLDDFFRRTRVKKKGGGEEGNDERNIIG